MRFLKFILLTIFCFQNNIAYSQVSGQIFTTHHFYLPFAKLDYKNNFYVADKEGRFSLDEFKNGDTIFISLLGYRDTFWAGQQNTVAEIFLEPNIYLLDEIVVSKPGLQKYVSGGKPSNYYFTSTYDDFIQLQGVNFSSSKDSVIIDAVSFQLVDRYKKPVCLQLAIFSEENGQPKDLIYFLADTTKISLNKKTLSFNQLGIRMPKNIFIGVMGQCNFKGSFKKQRKYINVMLLSFDNCKEPSYWNQYSEFRKQTSVKSKEKSTSNIARRNLCMVMEVTYY